MIALTGFQEAIVRVYLAAGSRISFGQAVVESLVQAASSDAQPISTEAFLALQAVAVGYCTSLAPHWDDFIRAIEAAISRKCTTGKSKSCIAFQAPQDL